MNGISEPVTAEASAGRMRAFFGKLASGRGADAALSFAIRFGGSGLTFITQIWIARWMGLAEFGAFSNAWVWVALLGTLAQAGFSTATTRFGSAARAGGDSGGLLGLAIASQLLVLGLGIAVGIIAALFALATAAGPSQRDALLIGALCIPIFAQVDVLKGLARVRGLASIAYAPGFLLRPLLFFGLVALLWASSIEIDATAAMACMLAALLASWIVQKIIVRRRLAPLVANARPSWNLRGWIAGSLPVVVCDGYLLFVASIDVILVNALGHAEDGGAYFAAARSAALASYVLFAVASVSQRDFAGLWAERRIADLDSALRASIRRSLWPTLALGLCLLVFGEAILSLFGPGFAAGYPILAILVAGHIAHAAAGPVRTLLLMSGQQNALAVLLAVAALLGTALCWILTLAMGPIGAAIATSASMLGCTIAMVLLARARLGIWSVIGAPMRVRTA